MNVLVICGSNSRVSFTKACCDAAKGILEEKGVEVDFLCCREVGLGMFDAYDEQNGLKSKNLIERCIKADGIIAASPEYHGGVSGCFKNLIDHLDIAHLKDKPVVLLSTSGGEKAGINTLNMMRLIFRALHAFALPEQVSICESEFDSDKGEFKPETIAYLAKAVNSLVRYIDSQIAITPGVRIGLR